MNDLYVRIPDSETLEKVYANAKLSPWDFDFPNRKYPLYSSLYGMYVAMKLYYHGRSKLLLHLFYNDITRCYEMQFTTATTEKSYPHIRNKRLNIIDFDELNYDLCCKVFGNPA